MIEQPKRQISERVIQRCETDNTNHFEHCMLMPTATMASFIKIKTVRSYVHPDASLQVCIDCLALNYEADVFELEINYTPHSIIIRDQLLKEFHQGGLMHVQGSYSIDDDDSGVTFTLHDPEYHSVAADEVIDVESLFLKNGSSWDR